MYRKERREGNSKVRGSGRRDSEGDQRRSHGKKKRSIRGTGRVEGAGKKIKEEVKEKKEENRRTRKQK